MGDFIIECKKSKIFDCFTFFNELDLLELRLEELYDYVDYFVLVEASYTFQNKPKPLFFLDNKKRFQKFLDKIIHVIVHDKPERYPNYTDYEYGWRLEIHQRNAISRGLVEATNEDWICISDVDELINPWVFNLLNDDYELFIICAETRMYFLNLVEKQKVSWKDWLKSFFSKKGKLKYYEKKYWTGSKIIKLKNFKQTANEVRWLNAKSSFRYTFIKNGGWHFTYFGGLEKIKEKIYSFSHAELIPLVENGKLEESVKKCLNFFNPQTKIYQAKNLDDLPLSVRRNPEKYSKLMLQ